MKCNYCGAEIADNAFFCVVCGKTITRSDGKNRRKVDLSKPCDNNLNLDSDVFDDSSDVTWRAFDFDPPMYSEETVSVPENTILLEEPSIVNPQFPEEPSIMNTYPQEEPQMIRILPEESKQNQNVSFDLQQNGVLPDGERQVIPPPVQRQTIPLQNAVTAPDINAMRNNVIAGFAYRHYNKADYFGKVEGQPKSFTLFGNTLTITPDKDAFNTYRLKFRDLAFRYTNKFIREYSLLVVNLETFVQYFPALYLSNMEYVIHTAMDVLAGELALFPYNKPVFFRMTRMYGDTPEISAVRQYFGYTDLGNPRII